jgi:hypothetical protein
MLSLLGTGPGERLPRTSPMEPLETLKSFRIVGSFRLDLIAFLLRIQK